MEEVTYISSTVFVAEIWSQLLTNTTMASSMLQLSEQSDVKSLDLSQDEDNMYMDTLTSRVACDIAITVFTRSNAVATIYFIARVCAAFIREWHLLILVAAREAIRRETVD